MNESKDQKFIYEAAKHPGDFKSSKIKKVIKIINELRKEKTDQKVLDIACNEGYFSEIFFGFEYYGVDIIKVSETNPLKDRIKQADITNGFPYEDGFFDVVFASEILEHIFDTDFFLKECSRILNKKGVLILTTPNCVPLHSRVRTLIFGTRPFSTESRVIVGKTPGHIRAFTKGDLLGLFQDNNFKIEKMQGKEIKFIPFGKKLADIFPSLSTGFVIKARNTKNR